MSGLLYPTPPWMEAEWDAPEDIDISVRVPDEISDEQAMTAFARERDNYRLAAEALDLKIKELQQRKFSAVSGERRLRAEMLSYMLARGLSRVKTPEYTIIQTTGRTMLEVENPDEVGLEWRKAELPPIEKNRLNKHFRETGEIPDGCRVVTSPPSLTIRSA